MQPDTLKTTPAAIPTLSHSCDVTLNKKEARKLHRLFYPLTRPAQVSPRKKVAWRLVRKWFNHYEKPTLIGRSVVAVAKDGKTRLKARITNVRIYKAGGHKRSYEFELVDTLENCIEVTPDSYFGGGISRNFNPN